MGQERARESPALSFSQLPQTMAMPESERDTRGQPRERPDPASSCKPAERSGPKGEISLGSQTPRELPACLDSGCFWKVTGPEKRQSCRCGGGSRSGHGGKHRAQQPHGHQTVSSSSAVGKALLLLAS